jgi:hypothetical protein
MSTSYAATRPPPFFLQSTCAMHAAEGLAQHDADLLLLVRGNWSMMRSTVLAALVVCSVPNTR